MRCAETTRASNGTPSDSSAAEACCIVSQSDCEPMMIPTSGCEASFGMARCYGKRTCMWVVDVHVGRGVGSAVGVGSTLGVGSGGATIGTPPN